MTLILPPHHYLSPINASLPVISSDAIDKDTIFCTPLDVALMPVHNGTGFEMRQVGQLPVALDSGHLAGVNYSIFSFDVSGTTVAAVSHAWANSGFGTASRGTGGAYPELTKDGVTWLDVNANAMTMSNGTSLAAGRGVYLGDFCPSSNGHVTCHVDIRKAAEWGIFNNYNRQPLQLRCTNPVHDWIINSRLYAPPNNQPTPSSVPPMTPVLQSGWAPPAVEDWSTEAVAFLGQVGRVDAEYSQIVYSGAEGFAPRLPCNVDVAIRINSEVYASGNPAARGQITASGENISATVAAKVSLNGLGRVKASPCATIESGPAGAVAQFWGTEESMVLKFNWWG